MAGRAETKLAGDTAVELEGILAMKDRGLPCGFHLNMC